ncbi:MAG: c-type cytochrome domain-containing protein [Verrucomicrobiota bacterium]
MAEHHPSTTPSKKPWALTFFGLLAAAGLVAMPFLAGAPDGDKMPDIVRFLGHFHPLLLHLPIGVFILIVLQELGAIFGKRHHEKVAHRAMFPLFFGVVSSILAVIAGFLLYHGGDEYAGNALAERHLWGGLIFAVVAVITFIMKAWTVALDGNPAFYRMLLFTSVTVMGFASHDGASITHGENYMTEYAPNPVRSLLGLEKKAGKGPEPKPIPDKRIAEQFVYTDIVKPILERRCVQCHKESKAKGKFRMDTYEMLVKGGKEGPGIEPGKSAESNILIRIALPKDDEEHMPPEGKPQIEDSEVAIIKWWIDNGADPKKSIKEFEVPAAIKEAIAKLVPGSPAESGDSSDSKETAESSAHPAPTGPDEALKASVAGISKEFPGALSFESQQSSLLTFTAVSLRGNLDDAGFKKLEPVTSQFVTVDLSATKITDKAVAQLGSSKNLRLIRLAETGVTDAAIDTLLKIPTLESINLYGTKVTDAGVSKLSALTNLKRLYLWQTAVTPEAIKALKEKLPACEIITGIDS